MNRIDNLDALRALAALSVFFYHIAEVAGNPFHNFFNMGGIGVDLFFVLSGFCIGMSVIRSQEWCWKNFARKRFLRLAPAYYFSILIIVLLVMPELLFNRTGYLDIFTHLTFIHTYSYQTHGSINGVYWSLGVEASFYVLMALSAVFLRDSRKIWPTLALWIIISWTWRYIIATEIEAIPIYKFILSTQLIGTLDAFAFGVIVAKLTTIERISSKLFQPNPALALLIGSLILLYQYQNFAGSPIYWDSAKHTVLFRSMLAFTFSLLIIAFIGCSQIKFLTQTMHYSGLLYLGKISFGIYLFHLPLMRIMTDKGLFNSDSNYYAGFVCLLFTIIFGSLSYHLVEKRFYPRLTKIA
ncbi:acyltransferase [Motilimonas sp. 1_MG-2023]|uniref:acyltransferase family protein n=1 Tax=Motilimonas sp. 1_MG-2023 TaxID=3062672 RepID=UPI0026E177DA|nr:acyltransferase [Motilimonas sp. 1_MG-2023]MDO6527414.1 acyltransferase [Motilimonas sp. 1_MG-2023]